MNYKTMYIIILMSLIMLGYNNCGGNINTFHDSVDCAIWGKNCAVSNTEFDRYKEEQDVKLAGIDAQIAEAMDILGTDRLNITEIVNLCGNGKEILIRINNDLVAFHSRRGGYLDFLSPGRYITTDGFSCRFDVNNDMEVVYVN